MIGAGKARRCAAWRWPRATLAAWLLLPLLASCAQGGQPAATPAVASAGASPFSTARTATVAAEATGRPAPATAAIATPTRAVGATPADTPRAGGAASPSIVVGERLIYAQDGKLWARAIAGGGTANLTPDLPPRTFANDPALSPDGTTLAFALLEVPPAGRMGALSTSDLYAMELDGANRRRILAHDRPGAMFNRPSWTPDGTALVYGYSAPEIDANGRFTATIVRIERLELAGGQRATLVADAEEPTIATGALAYVPSPAKSALPELRIAAPDGRGARQLVGTEHGFTAISAPRFSPDGAQLVFTAAGRGPNAGGGAIRPVAARPEERTTHGAPSDLWAIAVDGTGLRRLTAIDEDSPVAVWSPDGRRIGFVAGAGIYIVGADGRGLTRLSERGTFSAVVWVVR